MTIEEIEQIEMAAHRGEAKPETILILTAYLRNILQLNANAEALLNLHRKDSVVAAKRAKPEYLIKTG